jgi:aspartyl-tRNA(Asn)/glutamyl-tRNA(Gln) amidotransferase subunit C
MSLSPEAVRKIAHLARLNLSEDEIQHYVPRLSNILNLIEQMSQVDTTNVAPLAHPFDLTQRLRPDAVTETDLRDKYQRIAPSVEAGLYLVPKVIDEA